MWDACLQNPVGAISKKEISTPQFFETFRSIMFSSISAFAFDCLFSAEPVFDSPFEPGKAFAHPQQRR